MNKQVGIKVRVMVCFLIIFFNLSSFAFAQRRKIPKETEVSQVRWNLVKKSFGFLFGWYASLLGHELGHQFVAIREKVDMTWSNGANNWDAHTDDKSKKRNIALGGFASEIISSEVILNWDKIPKDNSFVVGYMFRNIINPIRYTIKNETSGYSDEYYNDLRTIDRCGLKDEYVEAIIVACALVNFYRLQGRPSFQTFLNATEGELKVGVKWEF